jgi:hypothetical protein
MVRSHAGNGESCLVIAMTRDGDFPHNTSGGQLSVGQSGAGGDYLGLVEAIRHLTDETGAAFVILLSRSML